MKYISFEAADALYASGEHFRLNIETVDHTALRRFYWAVVHLERELGDALDDDTTRYLVSRLRRHRFDLCSAPLPLNWHAANLQELLSSWSKTSISSYTSLRPHLQLLAQIADELAQSVENPQLEAIEQLSEVRDQTRAAILVKATRLFNDVEQIIVRAPLLQSAHIISEYELRLPECYDHLIVIGPRQWFPDFVFTAPRAPIIDSIRYRWLRDTWETKPAFIGALRHHHAGDIHPSTAVGVRQGALDPESLAEDHLDCDDAFWSVEWTALATRMAREVAEGHDQEEVEAHVAVLAGNMAVWLEDAEDAKVLTLDIDEDEDDDFDEESPSRVMRISTSQLRPGMFLLLRMSGGGDYIVPVADKLLGSQATYLRAMQDAWKSALRMHARSKGLLATSIDLLDLGSQRANETNLRNWMSSRNIRPRDYADFNAIMQLIGLDDCAQEHWRVADVIEIAHRKAGFYFRKQLLKQVLSADLKVLLRTGRIDFHLSEVEGGSFSAFRVEQVMPERALVPTSRLGRPFSLEDPKWRA